MIVGKINSKKTLTGKINNATKYITPTLENIEITPSKQEQIFNHPASDGYDEVKVKAIVGDELNVSPTIQKQEFNGLYEKVNVNGVTSEVDTNIIPENIKENVSILGVKGTFVGAKYKPRFISFYYYAGDNLDYELANLDTSLITSLQYTFSNTKVKNLDLSNFDTSNVTNMYMAIYSNNNLTTLNVNNLDTSKVTNMGNAISGNGKLTSLDLSAWNTSNVTNMSSMLSNNTILTSLDLSNFNTSNVTNMSYMFSGCKALSHLDIRNFDFTKVTTYNYMFRYVPTTCLIIVKDSTAKSWLNSKFSSYTNVKTVAELGE